MPPTPKGTPPKQGNMAKTDTDVLLEHYNNVNESIKSVFDLTSRIDERVKMLVERQGDLEQQLDKAIDNQQQILNRVTVLESRDVTSVVASSKTDIHDIKQRIAIMENSGSKQDIEDIKKKIHLLDLRVESINMRTANQESRWAKLFDLVFKLTIMLIGGYLLFRFGWQAPP
jgi:HPt (histidine-containing phosphotransfer) domain-containing protein